MSDYVHLLTDPAVILSFLTLAALEIVLGIDNLLFVQIVAGRVSPERQPSFRRSMRRLSVMVGRSTSPPVIWNLPAAGVQAGPCSMAYS